MLKIAVLHSDRAVADCVGACAAQAGMELVCPDSPAALETLLEGGKVRAAVLDIAGPHGGGFELIEKVCAAPGAPAAVVVTDLDAKTIQSAERLAREKSLNLTIFKTRMFNAERLAACLPKARGGREELSPDELRRAIADDFLVVSYQPKVPFAPGAEGVGNSVEALVRLRHPELGDVFPDQFIGVAERHGLIQDLTDAVTRKTFADIVAWRESGLALKAAINVSPLLLNDMAWSASFLERCEEFGVGPEHVTLEITESSMGAENAAALDVLTRLRLKGFTLSIDDFGTGFSSLANLYKLPFGELKLDKSFVMDLSHSEEARALIETTVSMARRIGLKVVAEGIESQADFDQLRVFGCDYAQGYFISRPVAADRIPGFFAEWPSRAPAPGDRGETAAEPKDDRQERTADAAASADAAVTPPASGDRSKLGLIQALLSDVMSATEGDETMVLDPDTDPAAAADPVSQMVRRIPSLVMQNRAVEALSACHEALLSLEDNADADPGVVSKLMELEELLESEMLAGGPLDLSFEGGARVGLVAGTRAVIGRASASGEVDIPTACRWFSRGERNLCVYARDGEWLVEDLGSTNGNRLGDTVLEPGQPQTLPAGRAEVRPGRDADSAPPVAIELVRTDQDADAVVARLVVDENRIENAAAEVRWDDWPDEIAKSWIVFGDRVSIGADGACAIQDPAAAAPVVAEIFCDNGYWIRPVSGAPVMVGEIAFHRALPMPMDAPVSVGGVRFTVRQGEGPKRARPVELPAISFASGA